MKKLPEIQLKLNNRYNSSHGSSPFHTLYGFTTRFGQPQLPYPLIKIVAKTDRHAEVTKNLKLEKKRQSFQANKRRNQPPRWKIGQSVMLSSHNINLPNVNKQMIPRWLGLLPITQVNKQRNNYTLDLSNNPNLRHIHKTFDIGVLKHYCDHNCHGFPQHHYREPGPVKHDRYEVEKAVNFRFSHAAREPLYQIRCKGYLPSQNRCIYSNEIDQQVKSRFWQEEHLKPTFQRRRCHRGRPGPRKRS